MKILVTGANGQLGMEIGRQARNRTLEMVGVDIEDIDICSRHSVDRVMTAHSPDLVVNAAAYTAVDQAETDVEKAFAVNRDGPANLAAACRTAGVALIHISTDFVFDGRKETPYLETDPVAPIGVYGRSKAEGESAVRAASPTHLIVRTAWLYGVSGHNFVRTMLGLGRKRREIDVVADQYGSPTSAVDLAGMLLDVAERISTGAPVEWGIYHYCGSGVTTWHGFAEEIFNVAERLTGMPAPVVRPVATEAYPTPARRPAFSALNCDRLYQAFGIRTRPWQESLEQVVRRVCQP